MERFDCAHAGATSMFRREPISLRGRCCRTVLILKATDLHLTT